MSIYLRRELNRVEKNLLELSGLVEEHIVRAVKAFEEHDPRLAEKIRDADAEVDRAEVDLEEECLKILALYQPVANDLRFVVSALKINNDLERVGDLASTIAKRAVDLSRFSPVEAPSSLRNMAEAVTTMLRESLDAFVRLDREKATDICALDQKVDALEVDVREYVKNAIREGNGSADVFLDIFRISRALERVGDHATNIAEDVVYLLDGEIVRHGGH